MTYTAPALTAHAAALSAAATKDRVGGSRVAEIVRAWHALDPRCVLCLTVTDFHGAAGDRPTFGHIIPASTLTPGATGGKRGGYTADNAALVCTDCNHAIGDTVMASLAFEPVYFGTFPATRRVRRVETGSGKASARAALGY